MRIWKHEEIKSSPWNQSKCKCR